MTGCDELKEGEQAPDAINQLVQVGLLGIRSLKKNALVSVHGHQCGNQYMATSAAIVMLSKQWALRH